MTPTGHRALVRWAVGLAVAVVVAMTLLASPAWADCSITDPGCATDTVEGAIDDAADGAATVAEAVSTSAGDAVETAAETASDAVETTTTAGDAATQTATTTAGEVVQTVDRVGATVGAPSTHDVGSAGASAVETTRPAVDPAPSRVDAQPQPHDATAAPSVERRLGWKIALEPAPDAAATMPQRRSTATSPQPVVPVIGADASRAFAAIGRAIAIVAPSVRRTPMPIPERFALGAPAAAIAFPLSLAVAIALYLLVQHRIDRADPRLVRAGMRPHDLRFR